jgi:DNA-directed RNA polymerase specialized sigma24 family protein
MAMRLSASKMRTPSSWQRIFSFTRGVGGRGSIVAKGTWEPDLRRHIATISDADAMRIDAAVAKLRGTQRIVIEAIYKDWIPWKNLPEELGVSVNTIRKYQHQGLGALEVLLGVRH